MISPKNFTNIRLFALFSILTIHSALMNYEIVRITPVITTENLLLDYSQLIPQTLYINIFRSGTILFFLISGFLFQMQIEKFNNFWNFFKKKSKSLLHPYFILFFIPTIFLIGFVEPHLGKKEDLNFYLFSVKILDHIFFTSYWFIPAIFIILMVNYFISTKYLIKSLILFVLIWFVAYLNLYLKFATTDHTIWFVAFFSVFALGRLIFTNNERIAKISLFKSKRKTALVVFSCYVVSNLESMLILIYGHNSDYTSILKIGNIAYSLTLFVLLNEIFSSYNFTFTKHISFYFMYLVHPFVLKANHFFLNKYTFTYPSQLFYNIIHTLVVLTLTFIAHQIFFKLKINSKYISDYVFKKNQLFKKKLL